MPTMLSEHFSLEEMTVSDTAARLGLNNQPGPDELEHLKVTCAGLEQVRALLGHPIHINSGFRSEAVNGGVPGSSKTSAHVLGYAADITCVAFGTPLEICRAIAASGMKFDQIIHEYRAWCHVSFDPQARGMLLSKFKDTNYEHGLLP